MKNEGSMVAKKQTGGVVSEGEGR